MLALLNLASGECAERDSKGQAGIQNDFIFRYFPGFRVSPTIFGFARNDSFAGLQDSHKREGERG
jgi:hypothetical protein